MSDIPQVEDIKTVWVAWTNTDLTEGRGAQYPLVVCDAQATAKRLGKGKSVQGSDCLVKEGLAVRIDGRWLAPTRIEAPSQEDEMRQAAIDAKREAIAKAKSLGLSEDDIKAIRNG